MAGEGRRFVEAGYDDPKPFIDVNTPDGVKPMIGVVTNSLGIDVGMKLTLLVGANVLGNSLYMKSLRSSVRNASVIPVRSLTQGAACTVLLTKEFINNDDPLMIVNSDQNVKWSYVKFMQHVDNKQADAGMLTFTATDVKWSFALTNESGYVTRVAEKERISDVATCGIYWWRHGKDFVRFAESMIKKNIRVNNEFYVCPVFNEAIEAGLKIVTFDVDRMSGLGTPEDLERYNGNNQ
jgi:dTDP-glucose pyrophosphorylase